MSDSDDGNMPNSQPKPDNTQSPPTIASLNDQPTSSYDELLENAKKFLQDESIKSAPIEKQRTFLEEKGLKAADIQQLLQSMPSSGNESSQDLTTIYDSTKASTKDETRSQEILQANSTFQASTRPPPLQRDAPPIITYPEFLLKPQKPPPIVTFQRLVYASYGLAALSALTYSASKYLVEPLLQNLTVARHELASKALENIEKLNEKLEASVSHVPYTASLGALKAQHEQDYDDESVDSDPTELFHRDIATQTSPQLSRASSFDSPDKKSALDATERHASRLAALHETLESLVSSVDTKEEPFLPPSSTKKLHDSMSQLQAMLDKLESTYNPFRSDYNNIYSNPTTTTLGSGRGDNNEAAKFKAEIRSLKGVFLSSRNFPAARPTAYATTSGR